MKKLLTAMFCIAISTAVLTATVIATGCTDKFAPKDKNYFEFRIVNNTVYRVIELESETPERVDDYPLVSAANINFSDPTVYLTAYSTYENNCIFFKDSDAGKFTKKGIQEIYKILKISGPKLEDSVNSCFTTDVSTFNEKKIC